MDSTFILVLIAVLVLMAFLYRRKQRKEKQMELDLETLTAKSDWVGVSNILKRQVYTWGALFLLTIGLLVASIVTHHKVIAAAITTAFMAYRFIKVYRLYRVFKDSVKTDDEEHVDIDELRRLTKEFLDCRYQEFDSSTTVFEITEAYKSALERGKSQGFYPVLVPVSENNFIGLTAEINPDGPCYSVDMKKVRAWRRNMLATAVTDGHKKIDELLAESKADIEQDGSLDWRKDIIGECEEKLEGRNCFFERSDNSLLPYDYVLLAEVPVKHAWEVFAWLPFCAYNYDIAVTDHMAVAKYWFERYGAVPAYVDSDMVGYYLDKPIAKSQAIDVALEHFAYCPDYIYQGYGTIANAASSICDSSIWEFWWD